MYFGNQPENMYLKKKKRKEIYIESLDKFLVSDEKDKLQEALEVNYISLHSHLALVSSPNKTGQLRATKTILLNKHTTILV